MKLLKAIIKAILGIIIVAILVLIIFLGIVFLKEYIMIRPKIKDGYIEEKVEELRKKENYTKFEDVDKKYIDALIAAEDHRYYNHGPFDYIAIGRAIKTNIKSKDFVEGGSTITQQVAKNLFLDQNQTMERKIQEAIYAICLEKRYTKDEIIEMYMNISYFGSGYYTIYDASMGYFGKEPNDLTLSEAAFLAGVVNAPSVYDPRNNYQKAIQRRNIVLNKMVTYGKIESSEANKVQQEELEVKGL